MWDRVELLVQRYHELTRQLADPAVLADPTRYRDLVREHAQLEEVVTTYEEYRAAVRELEEAEALREESDGDAEARAWLEDEVERLRGRRRRLEERLKGLLLPRDPRDERNVIVEIRAGTGGEEAALFAADLYRMYARYAERHGWRVEPLSLQETDMGGLREAVVLIQGRGAFSRLKYERGVHRVQRVPVTESGGRIHTSTATVAVLPEAEEVDVEIRPEDLEIETFRASGHGGQHVNKTESAVRITHLPTGIVVTCQDERSQHKNRERAMKILRARLLDRLQQEKHQQIAEERRAQVGTGERSERIRTYNFPQNRVTDHRIGLTVYRLGEVLDGDLDEFIDALAAAEAEERLQPGAADLQAG